MKAKIRILAIIIIGGIVMTYVYNATSINPAQRENIEAIIENREMWEFIDGKNVDVVYLGFPNRYGELYFEAGLENSTGIYIDNLSQYVRGFRGYKLVHGEIIPISAKQLCKYKKVDYYSGISDSELRKLLLKTYRKLNKN